MPALKDAETGAVRVERSASGISGAASRFTCLRDGTTLASAGDDTIRVWDVEKQREIRRFHFVSGEQPPAAEPT
jgi:hypothetical protein